MSHGERSLTVWGWPHGSELFLFLQQLLFLARWSSDHDLKTRARTIIEPIFWHDTCPNFSKGSPIMRLANKLIISLIAALAPAACGIRQTDKSAENPPAPPGDVSDEMETYLKLFTDLADLEGVKIKNTLYSGRILNKEDFLSFGAKNNLKISVDGCCTILPIYHAPSFPDYKSGQINQILTYVTVKRNEDPIKQKTTIFHELGHCLLNLRHTEGKDDIMSASPARIKNEEEFAVKLHRLFQSANAASPFFLKTGGVGLQ